MHLYLAAPYRFRTTINTIADWLATEGYTIVSTWHTRALEALDVHILENDYSDQAREHALVDCEDIDRANHVLVFTLSPQTAQRGGRHFETGYAYGRDIPVSVLGQAEHVFHRLPGITIYPTLMDWCAAHPAA